MNIDEIVDTLEETKWSDNYPTTEDIFTVKYIAEKSHENKNYYLLYLERENNENRFMTLIDFIENIEQNRFVAIDDNAVDIEMKIINNQEIPHV